MIAPKPVTAKQVQKLIVAYETDVYNRIRELTAALDGMVQHIDTDAIDDCAVQLHQQLQRLYDTMARAEKDGGR